MRLPDSVRTALWRPLFQIAKRRGPDVKIGGEADPYMLRWHVIPRNRLFNVYLHQFLRSDDDRALHSHPWLGNASVLLRGSYTEHTAAGSEVRVAGDVKARLGAAFHRIELTSGVCWTLFVTGPRVRLWGFACAKGFVPWFDFARELPGGISEISAGCGEPS